MSRRVGWTAGLALPGFALAWYSQPYPYDSQAFVLADAEVILAVTTGAALIGFLFGTIFGKKPHGWRLIVCWMVTGALSLALLPLGLLLPVNSFAAGEAAGSAIGAAVGLIVGILHSKFAEHDTCRRLKQMQETK